MPKGDSWPASVDALANRLRKLVAERRVAAPARRGELAASIRRLTGELEQAKVEVMSSEGLAA